MNFGKTKTLAKLLAIGCVLLTFSLRWNTTACADDSLVLVVATSKIEDLLGDFAYITEAVGFPQVGQMGTLMAGQYTEGLDDSRPIGFMLKTDGEEFKPLGMLPVEDLAAFLGGLEAQIGEPEDAGDGIFELAGPAPIYVKESSGWAFVAQSTDDLKDLPSDPLKILADMNTSYDVAVRGFIQNIPQKYKDLALEQLREGVEMQLENLPEEEDTELQRQLINQTLQQYEEMFQGVDELTFGWLVDSAGKKVQLDINMTTVPETKMARQMKLLGDIKTRFAGFLWDHAAIRSNTTVKMAKEDIERTLSQMASAPEKVDEAIEECDYLMDNGLADAFKEFSRDMIEILKLTIQSGTLDTCGSVLVEENGVTIVSGMNCADGEQLEAAVKELAQAMEEKSDLPAAQIGFDQHAGVRFHKITIPVPADQEQLQQVLGENVDVILGVSKESAYVAIGKKGDEWLRKSIDGSKSELKVSPFEVHVALGPIAKYVASMMDDDETVAAVATALEDAKHDDLIAVFSTIDNGGTYRLEVQEGVLTAIGEGIQASQAE